MLRNLLASKKPSPDDILALQRARLADAVCHARAHSPLFAELYRDLPDTVTDPGLLPITTKPGLMADFDRWTTDRAITRERVEDFLAHPELAGTRFLGKYLVTTTSGTTGRRGLFVLSPDELRAVSGPAYRISTLGLLMPPVRTARLLAKRFRTATIMVSIGHHAMNSLWTQAHGTGSKRHQRFSSMQPLPELVARLNAFDPATLTGTSGVVALLAGEKAAGRLQIAPAIVMISGETLSEEERALITSEFGARVIDMYAANEALRLSTSCAHGWHHVFTDWVIFEPVEEDYSPTPVGRLSHSVLISVLYRRTQPLLRYELGDSVQQRPDPCPCGSPFPAFKVHGRTADVLRDGDGNPVAIAQLLLLALTKRVEGIRQLQLVQSDASTLRLRMLPADGTSLDELWPRARDEFESLLAEHDLSRFAVERADEPPRMSPGGKFRTFVPIDA
ncbi:phenylacetate--CoA ligase family protein [Hoyosella sp. G463]|uniref:Phenylacetate--CoA ligase family protein n=1 Tax=Lolliginicoccus lacisalsi TaxID=2742202 RepID=A0A927PKQ8_9ACTN|nr:phenylacetate--CoA ligase family protein [Lolliginicoccus lacisalsi]MBD8505039.1 phenylacetate--CoA ligase family protein [Lolliginicoccus lacisalsi]